VKLNQREPNLQLDTENLRRRKREESIAQRPIIIVVKIKKDIKKSSQLS
jgi:hypothetical protein